MKRKFSIAVIICWYGEYPWYFPYFIHSCKFNPSIDFFIITENDELIENKPENVHIVKMSFCDLKVKISSRLGFDVNIDHPYKLCDFKPAYGHIFSDIISKYDYWAQSDMDVIYGDIRSFLTKKLLSQNDFISIRHDYTTGCFAIYKNSELMNSFFKRSKDYQNIFSSSKHFCFDECNFAWDELTEGKSIFEIKTEIQSFTHLIREAVLLEEISAHFDFLLMEGLTGKITFNNGKIIYKNQFEAILYHLFWLKRAYIPNIPISNIPDFYHISPSRIYHHRKESNKKKLIN